MTSAFKPARAVGVILHGEAARVWNAWADEFRVLVNAAPEPNTAIYDKAVAAKEQAMWPCAGLGDEYLVAALLRLTMAYSMAAEGRRRWMADSLINFYEVAEGMVDRACSPPRGEGAPPLADGQRARAPEPGEPGYRADVHG